MCYGLIESEIIESFSIDSIRAFDVTNDFLHK